MLFNFTNRDRLQNSLVKTHDLCNCGQYSRGACPTCNPITQKEIEDEKAKQNKPSISNFRDFLGTTEPI